MTEPKEPKPKNPDIVVTDSSISFRGEDMTKGLFRAVVCRRAIDTYIATGLIPTHGITITKLLKVASEYTGKTYGRSKDEQIRARNDLTIWINTLQSAIQIEDEREKKDDPTKP